MSNFPSELLRLFHLNESRKVSSISQGKYLKIREQQNETACRYTVVFVQVCVTGSRKPYIDED